MALAEGLPELYDFGLDGEGYLIDWAFGGDLYQRAGYVEEYPDLVIERRDQQASLTENKLDWLDWRSQRSWHLGAGQARFDNPETSEESAFFTSYGVDVTVPGQATPLPNISLFDTLSTLKGMKLLVAGGFFWNEYVQLGAYVLRKNNPTAGTSTFTTSNGAQRPYSLATDGLNVYIALGASGMDKGLASGSSSTQYTTTDVRSIAWCKQQLVGAGVKTGTVWRLLAIPTAAAGPVTPTEILALPDGFTVERNAITETGGNVYFGCSSDHLGVIYAWDGINTPYVAVQLPEGDQVTCLANYVGSHVIVGARRLSRIGTVDKAKGVIYVGTPDASGHLQLTEIVSFGRDDATYGMVNNLLAGPETEVQKAPFPPDSVVVDYAPLSMATRGQFVYFQWVGNGLGVIDMRYTKKDGRQPYSTHLYQGAYDPSETGKFVTESGDVVVNRERLFFSQGGMVWSENQSGTDEALYVAFGQITGSVMDWNIDSLKNFIVGEVGYLPLGHGSVLLEVSLDRGVTWTSVGRGLSGTSRQLPIDLHDKVIQYRVTLIVANAIVTALRDTGKLPHE